MLIVCEQHLKKYPSVRETLYNGMDSIRNEIIRTQTESYYGADSVLMDDDALLRIMDLNNLTLIAVDMMERDDPPYAVRKTLDLARESLWEQIFTVQP